MMRVFVEELLAEGRTLKSIVHETNAYQHFFTVYNPSPVAGALGNIALGTDTGAIADSNKESASEVGRLRVSAVFNKSKHDKKIAKLSKSDDQRYASSWSGPIPKGNQANRHQQETPHGPDCAT